MAGVYLNDWENFDDMARDFCDYGVTDEDHARLFEGVEVLLASYAQANYEGDAFVLFRKDGQLFEVNASHCSCYGLEDQWEPEPTTVAALRHRLDNGRLGNSEYSENRFADELRAVLDGLRGDA